VIFFRYAGLFTKAGTYILLSRRDTTIIATGKPCGIECPKTILNHEVGSTIIEVKVE